MGLLLRTVYAQTQAKARDDERDKRFGTFVVAGFSPRPVVRPYSASRQLIHSFRFEVLDAGRYADYGFDGVFLDGSASF